MTRTCKLLAVLLTSVAALAAPAEKWRFVVTGDGRGKDNGINATISRELAQAIVKEKPDLLLFSGDLVSGYTDAVTFEGQLRNWLSAMQPIYKAGIKVYAVMGNHETSCKEALTVWQRVFSGPYAMPQNGPAGEADATFSVRHKNTLFLGLDVAADHPYRVNQAWLDEQLRANKLPHVFAMTHMPCFKVQHEDTLADHPGERDAFWKSLARAGSRVYFCGHDHFYDHARIDGPEFGGLHQYVVGTAGAPIYNDAPYNGKNGAWTPVKVFHEGQFGYALVEIDGPNVTITWKHRTKPGVYVPGGDVYRYTVSAKS